MTRTIKDTSSNLLIELTNKLEVHADEDLISTNKLIYNSIEEYLTNYKVDKNNSEDNIELISKESK